VILAEKNLAFEFIGGERVDADTHVPPTTRSTRCRRW
jgi:hypothetical protein